MTWHLEVLARRQQRVLAQVGPPLSQRGFYLAGGTAIALHLGLRRSVDLDWFTHDGLDDPLATTEGLRAEGIAFATARGIRITSRADLAAMKLSAVAQRGAKKDFVDI